MATNSGLTPKWWTRLFNGLKSFFQSSLEWLSSFLPKRTRKSTPDSSKSNAPVISPPQDKVDSLGRTALMRAVAEHDIETVRHLLKSGANVNQVNEKATGSPRDPNTALGIAIATIRLGVPFDLEMIKLLLEHKASIKRNQLATATSPYLDTQSVLDYFPYEADLSTTAGKYYEAGEYKKLEKELFGLVAKAGNLFLDPKNKYFRIALETGHIATVENTLNFVRPRHILVYQTPIRSEAFFSFYGDDSPYGHYAPIPYALHHNQTEMALFLLKNALTDLNGATRQDVLNEALVFACYYNNTSVVEFCLKNGVAKEISHYAHDRMGFTALMAAAYMGNLSIVEQLLKNDIKINYSHRGKPGASALYCAITSNQNKQTKEAMVHLLLNHGAQLNSRTLKALVDSGFALNLENVPNFIDYLDEPEHNTEPYRQIIDQINEHNETVRHRMAQGIDVTNMPKPIIHMVTEYLLGEKTSLEGSDSSKKAGPSGDKPRTR